MDVTSLDTEMGDVRDRDLREPAVQAERRRRAMGRSLRSFHAFI
jgi:hypothetical protein